MSTAVCAFADVGAVCDFGAGRLPDFLANFVNA